VNGIEDSVFPIEDSLLAASHGNPKEVRLASGAGHMGRLEGQKQLNKSLVRLLAESYNHEVRNGDYMLLSKGDDLPKVRAYLTGHDNSSGESIIQSRIPLPWKFIDRDRSPMVVAYANNAMPGLNDDADVRHYEEKMKQLMGLVSSGGCVLRYVDFAPGYTCMMHRTQSLDFGIVLEGQVECLLDGDRPLLMRRGDVAIQRATLHAWRNPSKTQWARMVYCLQDCKPLYVAGEKMEEDLGSGAAFLPPSDNA
jgi:hypothetical protein